MDNWCARYSTKEDVSATENTEIIARKKSWRFRNLEMQEQGLRMGASKGRKAEMKWNAVEQECARSDEAQ